jgi:hypothetical protein
MFCTPTHHNQSCWCCPRCCCTAAAAAAAAVNPQELRKQNPQLMQQISAHQQEFMRMVMEAPAEGEDDDMAQMAQLLGAMGGGGAGGLPPGMVQVRFCTDFVCIVRWACSAFFSCLLPVENLLPQRQLCRLTHVLHGAGVRVMTDGAALGAMGGGGAGGLPPGMVQVGFFMLFFVVDSCSCFFFLPAALLNRLSDMFVAQAAAVQCLGMSCLCLAWGGGEGDEMAQMAQLLGAMGVIVREACLLAWCGCSGLCIVLSTVEQQWQQHCSCCYSGAWV